MSQTRSSTACAVAFAVQVTSETLNPETVKLHIQIASHLKPKRDLNLLFRLFECSELHSKALPESFSDIDNLFLQPQLIIIICDKSKGHVLSYSGMTSRRTGWSVLQAEIYAIADEIVTAYSLQKDLEHALKDICSYTCLQTLNHFPT